MIFHPLALYVNKQKWRNSISSTYHHALRHFSILALYYYIKNHISHLAFHGSFGPLQFAIEYLRLIVLI